MSYEIVEYAPEHRSGVLELQTHLWGPDRAVNAAYLEWKYDHNPYMDPPLIRLALCGERVVGMLGMYGAKWEIGRPTETFIGPCPGDLVVAPEHRRRGLARRLLERVAGDLARRGFRHSFTLSAARATQLMMFATGWRSPGPVELAAWPTHVPTAADRHGGAESRLAEQPSPFDALDREGGRSGGAAVGRVFLELAPRPEMAEVVERIGSDGRLRQVRDAEFFAWRYQNPLSAYRFLFWSDARLEGYLILQTPALRSRRPITIVDWEATAPAILAELLRTALRWGQFDDVTIWSATLGADAKAILREVGFRVFDEPGSIGLARREQASRQAILVCSLRDAQSAANWSVAGRSLLDSANWDIRAIDSDHY